MILIVKYDLTFLQEKTKCQKGYFTDNSKSLWKAVKIAKNTGHSIIPFNMTLNNVNISGDNITENFAEFFDKKVSDIVNATVINPRVQFVQLKFFIHSTNAICL